MKSAMRNNEVWTLWSRVILILLLAIDTDVHAKSSYDGDVKGCIVSVSSHFKINAVLM